MRQYYFRFGTANIPHPEKVGRGGEDGYWASDSLLVVADGVGGWADRGIDPGKYAKQLVHNIVGFHKVNRSLDTRKLLS